MTTSTTSARPNAHDRLRSLYSSPGPYTSLYLPCGALAATEPAVVLAEHRADLETRGSSPRALDALQARLGLPLPDDVGGWALHIADDGSTAVDFAPEGPTEPILHVGDLPMAAPMIEWDQWRVPHITVSVGNHGTEVVSFLPGAEPSITPLASDPIAATADLRHLAIAEQLRLIMVIDEGGGTAELVRGLAGVVPPHTNIVELGRDDWSTLDDIVDETVRYVSDVVARDTVAALEDFRFMMASGNAVEGTSPVFEALATGQVQSLLVHDDPTDPSAASFGPSPTDLSAAYADAESVARRVDVAIWSAIHQGVDIRVIPSTSANGPADDIGAVLRTSEADRTEWADQ